MESYELWDDPDEASEALSKFNDIMQALPGDDAEPKHSDKGAE